MDSLPPSVDLLFDEEAEIEALNGVLLPFRVRGFKQGVSQVHPQTVAEADVFTQAVKAAVQAQALEKAKLITGTTKDLLKQKLDEAIANGDSVQQFGKTVRDLYATMPKARSLTIARTEITGSVNYGAKETLRAEGYRQKEWSAVGDERTRESHAAADGQTVDIDHPFNIGGSAGMYPGDPMLPASEVISCRCTVLGTGLPDDRKAEVVDRYLRAHGALEQRLVVHLLRTFAAQGRRVLSRLAP